MRTRGRAWPNAQQCIVAAAATLLACALGGCGGGGPSADVPAVVETPPVVQPDQGTPGNPPMSAAARIGEMIFRDPSLSASGKQACISCHDPANGHAGPFDTVVAFGGPGMDLPGTRTSPSLRYLRFKPAFSLDASGRPSGGFFWDGRADSLHAQARDPFLNAFEMANADVKAVIDKLAKATYADDFRAAFGDGILANHEQAFDRVAFALERYQLEDPDFAPFTSRFDSFMAFAAAFTPQETNGYVLFDRADKGNCASCHTSTRAGDAPLPLFTNFGYANAGLPRNSQVPANADPAFLDKGLCAARPELAARVDLCGSFAVPSLRNVAVRKRFFHDGSFTTLEGAIRFHAPPSLTDDEVRDIGMFLRTLTDGVSNS